MLVKFSTCKDSLTLNKEYLVKLIQPWDNNSISEGELLTLVRAGSGEYMSRVFMDNRKGFLFAPIDHILVEVPDYSVSE